MVRVEDKGGAFIQPENSNVHKSKKNPVIKAASSAFDRVSEFFNALVQRLSGHTFKVSKGLSEKKSNYKPDKDFLLKESMDKVPSGTATLEGKIAGMYEKQSKSVYKPKDGVNESGYVFHAISAAYDTDEVKLKDRVRDFLDGESEREDMEEILKNNSLDIDQKDYVKFLNGSHQPKDAMSADKARIEILKKITGKEVVLDSVKEITKDTPMLTVSQSSKKGNKPITLVLGEDIDGKYIPPMLVEENK